MTVSTKLQPNNATQVGATYKAAIDATTHVHDRVAGAFACHQNDQGSPDAPDLTVRVDAGALVRAGQVPLEVAAQSTSALSAPSGNPRKDIVYIDTTTGAAGVATGAEAGSPTDPAVPAGKTAVARINWTVGMAEITNADLDDLRVGGSAPEFTGPDVSGSPQVAGTAGMVPAPQPGDEALFLRGDATFATPSDQIARDMAASAMALADANGVAGTVGAFYLADPFTSDTLAVKTNATYDSASDWYSPTASYTTTAVATLDADLGGYGTYTFVQVVPASAISVSGTKIKVRFEARSSSTGIDMANCYIGEQAAAGDAYDFSTTPTAITFNGGNAGFSISGGQQQESDEITFTIDETKSYLISFYASGNGNYRYKAALAPFTCYNKLANDAATVNKSGYASIADIVGINRITIRDAAPNMTLRPVAAAMSAANPIDVMFYALFYPVDSVTMGTDVIGKISIADGSPEDFTTGTFTQIGTYGNFELWRLDVDMTGKVGSTLEYSIETANNKEIRFKQSVGCVPLY